MTKKISTNWFVYLLECANGKLYTGITTNLEQRFSKHLSGKGAMFTKLNRPSHIVAAWPCQNRSDASKLEYLIKSLTPEQKRLKASQWPLTKDLPRHIQGS